MTHDPAQPTIAPTRFDPIVPEHTAVPERPAVRDGSAVPGRPAVPEADASGADAAEAGAPGAGDDGAPRSREYVQSLERGLAVIRAFDAEHPELTLSEVARATGLTRAAARRFLHTLVELGYVRSDGRLFALRPRVLDLGYAYLSSLTLPEVALPHLEAVVARVHESSSVSVLDGEEIVYVVRVPTKRIMRLAVSVGSRFPAYVTSMGRVLLAGQSDGWLDRYLASARLPPFTARTVTDPARLRAELLRVRAQGWAIVDQELEEGLRSVAVPIRDPDGRITAAMNMSIQVSRATVEAMRAELLPELLAAAAAIEEDLRGGQRRRDVH